MLKKNVKGYACEDDVRFMPALTPLEAAVLPASERTEKYGVLSLIRRAYDAGGTD